MSNSENPWVDAVLAWVSLATLLLTVERELGIPRNQAAKPLRQALETLEIDTAIIEWPNSRTSPQTNSGYWTTRARSDSPGSRSVAHEGWLHVDWDAGTIAGCDIRVRWNEVVRVLASVEAGITGVQVQPVRPTGGKPAKHDWDAFWIELALYASANDLFDVERAKVQRHMEQWSAEHMCDPTPNPATVRAKIKKLYDEVARARK